MTTRNRVENRAHLIYDYLTKDGNFGNGFTKPQLCKSLRIKPSATTEAAIRRARDLAAEAGYHFPPAVPQNGHRYKVTRLAEDALDPTLQMERIRSGVERRANVGRKFMEREKAKLPPDVRPLVTAYLTLKDQVEKSQATIQRAFDDAVIATVKARRETRDK